VTAETWLQFPEIDPNTLNNLLAKSLYRDYKQWTSNEAGRVLKDLDNSRHSWTNEDPSDNPLPPFIEEVPTAILELLPLARFGTYTKNFTFQKILSPEVCQVLDEAGEWQLRARVPDVKNLDLAMVQLDVLSLTSNEQTLEQCTVNILEAANH
jgi:hypothetical protein